MNDAWLIKMPDAFFTKDGIAIGTAGYTALFRILALEHGGITPDTADILVQRRVVLNVNACSATHPVAAHPADTRHHPPPICGPVRMTAPAEVGA
jgi:hypothetical protein